MLANGAATSLDIVNQSGDRPFMDRKSKSGYAGDAAEVGLVTAGAAIGGPKGAGVGVAAVVLAKLGRALELWRGAKQEGFLARVSLYLDEENLDAAATFVDEHADRDEFIDTLERGYAALRRSFDPLAAECICLLTAEHARLGCPTDRSFIRAAALLEESDEETLVTLDDIVATYISIIGRGETNGTRILFRSRGSSKEGLEPYFFRRGLPRSGTIRAQQRRPISDEP